MLRNKGLIAIVVLLLVGGTIYKVSQKEVSTDFTESSDVAESTSGKAKQQGQGKSHNQFHQDTKTDHFDDEHSSEEKPAVEMDVAKREAFIETSLAKLDAEEKKSLLELTTTIKNVVKGEQSLNHLLDNLQSLNTQPYVMKDENPVTGAMNVIRTKNTLPGTRYFHAQFFKDENGNDYAQHVSFEFKPSEYSFDGAKAALMKVFDITTEPNMEKDGFVSWRSGEYTVWAKKLTEEDFNDNAFNAHDKNDVGTIWVAMELEIHDHAAPLIHESVNSKQ